MLKNVRRWGSGLGLAASAAAAVITGAGAAHADTTDGLNAAAGSASVAELFGSQTADATTPDDLLAGANTNLTDGVTALVQELFTEPTNRDLAQEVSIQDGALEGLGRLQSAEDAISAHAGSASSMVNELFFAPVNQEWDTASEAVLNADQAYADAIANDTGVLAAKFDVLAADFQLLDANFSSIPIEFAGIFFGADFSA